MNDKELKVIEHGLIPVYRDKQNRTVVNARELHGFLESKRQFANWIQERIEKYGFSRGEDFEVFNEIVKNPQGGRPTTEFLLTLDTAKEIAMVENNERGRQVRKYFIECERHLKERSRFMGMTYDEATAFMTSPDTVMAIAQEWKKDRDKCIALEAKVAADRPKVLFADAVRDSKSSILIGNMAKLLRQNGVAIGQNRLFRWLRENGYLIKRQGSTYNMPTQVAMEKELFGVTERVYNLPDGSTRITRTVKVTGKGQVYFTNKFLADGRFESY